ncbi:hypothetical protein [Rhizobacter sp. SG703]|uniref:hypothetical protein n=1 Tax=Rhizobacter sp. SG703 TaxID=2587140 RepID=UPI001445A382|nr:hypothetical protein [Rhizobacter sp. SG703]NKI96641.1 hypothetical protein [Rhizobacter sp. SG703]
MKYFVDFQHHHAGSPRPSDDGPAAPIEFDPSEASAIVPNVGDYVQLLALGGNAAQFSGKVSSRLFRYFVSEDGVQSVQVNVVVKDTEDDWGQLVKE